ncbi:MAG: DUF4832 domain-containing protein [Candidatus Brocadiia bacterium]
MKGLLLVAGTLAFAGAVLFMSQSTAQSPRVTATFQESDEPVVNPDCGWVAYNYGDGYGQRRRAANGEPFRYASVVYTRHPTAKWVDKDGGFADSRPLQILRNWMDNGRHVAFRVYANSIDELPADVRARVDTLQGSDGEPINRIAYWDEDYIEHHRKLVQYLAEQIGDSPRLAYVDVGGVGNTGGEWHFHPLDEYRAGGLDDDTLYELVETFARMYREAFPHTRLFIGYDCLHQSRSRSEDVKEVLRRYDIGVRDDGLGGWPYPREDPPETTWPLQNLWREFPVLFEIGGKGGGVYGLTEQGKDPKDVLEWAFRHAPPTYVNIGGSETRSEKACQELGPLLETYGKRLGYRFVLLEASCRATMGRGRTAELRARWANRGVAPCYTERSVEVALFDAEGEPVTARVALPSPATTEWAPGEEVVTTIEVRWPEDLPPGRYTLKVALLAGDPREPGRRVRLATEGADAEGRYELGRVRVTP